MRVARFVGPGVPIELQEVPDPAPGPNEVVVRVEACGICASDLHFIHGEMPLPVPPPLTMGHEASGTIAAVGTEVPGWREGDRVAVMGGKPCLQCRNCVAGLIEDCQDAQIMGVHYEGAFSGLRSAPLSGLSADRAAATSPPPSSPVITFESIGSTSQRRMPRLFAGAGAAAATAAALSVVPGWVGPPVGPPGGASVGVARAVFAGGVRPGERVGVWGVGGLGTHAVQVALLAGASFVVAVDPLAEARERALALGADLTLDPSKDDVTNAIRDATGGRGLDLAVDAVGRAEAVRQAMFCMARGGRIVLVGQSFESLDAGPILVLSFLRIALLGHLCYGKRDLVEVLDLIASGRLDLSGSISGRLPLERVNDGVERLTSKAGAPVRLVVLPQA